VETILVTGAAGYIGSAICHRLLEEGYRVRALDNMQYGVREAIPKNAEIIDEDLQDLNVDLTGVSAVIHTAAESLIPRSLTNPDLYYNVNVVGGLNLLQAMRQAGVKRIIYSGTSSVYRVPIDSGAFSETDLIDPSSPYAETKYAFERMLFWFHRAYGIDYVTFRFFNVGGATEKVWERPYHQTRLIPMCLRVASGEFEALPIYSFDHPTPDGTCVRDHLHVSDVADAHVLALRRKDLTAETINLGLGKGYSNLQVVECARQVTGKAIPTKLESARPGEPPMLISDPTKAFTVLGWKPQFTTLESIVESAWKYTPNFHSHESQQLHRTP